MNLNYFTLYQKHNYHIYSNRQNVKHCLCPQTAQCFIHYKNNQHDRNVVYSTLGKPVGPPDFDFGSHDRLRISRQTTSNVDDDDDDNTDDNDDDDVGVIQIPGRATNPTLKKIS